MAPPRMAAAIKGNPSGRVNSHDAPAAAASHTVRARPRLRLLLIVRNKWRRGVDLLFLNTRRIALIITGGTDAVLKTKGVAGPGKGCKGC